MRDKLQALLVQMRFNGIAAVLDAELERAEQEATPAPELLYRLLCAEAASQRQRSLAYRLHQARMPWGWTLESFPFSQQPSINKAQIKALAGLDFLSRANNIVLTGKTGTGKSGIAIGILREACLNGYRGRFYDAQDLLDELYASLADRSTARLLKRLSRFQPLVIDKVDNLTINRNKPTPSSVSSTSVTTASRPSSRRRLISMSGTSCSATRTWSMRCSAVCGIAVSPFASMAHRYAARSLHQLR